MLASCQPIKTENTHKGLEDINKDMLRRERDLVEPRLSQISSFIQLNKSGRTLRWSASKPRALAQGKKAYLSYLKRGLIPS